MKNRECRPFVLVVGDAPIISRGLRDLLESQKVARVTLSDSYQEAADLLLRVPCDLLIAVVQTSFNLDRVRKLKALMATTTLVVVSDILFLVDAAVTADDALVCSTAEKEIMRTVRRLTKTERRSRTRGRPIRTAALSEKEARALAHSARGCRNAMIADHLGVALSTAKGILGRINRNLGTPNRLAAAESAVHKGYLELPPGFREVSYLQKWLRCNPRRVASVEYDPAKRCARIVVDDP